MKRLLYLFLLLSACGEPPINYVLQVKLQQLQPDDLYNENMVYDVVFDAQEQDVDSLKTQSRQLFLQGIDLYKNKRQPNRAIVLFKKSILMLPDAKTYYELGNALLETSGGAKEAIEAYEVAEHLQFQPVSSISFNKVLAYTLLDTDSEESRSYENQAYQLKKAFDQGYTDTLQLYKDVRFRRLVKSPAFKNMMISRKASFVQGNTDGLFGLFKRSFAKAQQPFEVPLSKVDMKEYSQSISYDFVKFIPEMQNTSFDREVSHEYFYVARVAETPQYVALLYSSVSFYDEVMQPVQTKLVTFSNQGQIISSLLFSCQCSAEKVKTGRIEQNLITLEDYKRVWKHPVYETDIEKNTVISHELLATATFRISESGKILTESIPDNYKENELLVQR